MAPSYNLDDNFRPAEGLWPSPPEFAIVVLYESPEAGTRAMRLCQDLVDRFSEEFLFQIELQPFKALSDFDPRTVLTRAAKKANLIFIAGSGKMSGTLIPWLHHVLHGQKADRSVGLVDLASEQAEGGIEFRQQLREFAREHHLDFFDPESVCHYMARLSQRPMSPTGLNTRHSGTNE
jgi:hypothetical protein